MTGTGRRFYSLVAAVAAAMLFWALARHSYDYYVLLRWIACVAAVYGVLVFWESRQVILVVPLAMIALLFNPIIPIHLSRSTWRPIDVVAGAIFCISAIPALVRRSDK